MTRSYLANQDLTGNNPMLYIHSRIHISICGVLYVSVWCVVWCDTCVVYVLCFPLPYRISRIFVPWDKYECQEDRSTSRPYSPYTEPHTRFIAVNRAILLGDPLRNENWYGVPMPWIHWLMVVVCIHTTLDNVDKGVGRVGGEEVVHFINWYCCCTYLLYW